MSKIGGNNGQGGITTTRSATPVVIQHRPPTSTSTTQTPISSPQTPDIEFVRQKRMKHFGGQISQPTPASTSSTPSPTPTQQTLAPPPYSPAPSPASLTPPPYSPAPSTPSLDPTQQSSQQQSTNQKSKAQKIFQKIHSKAVYEGIQKASGSLGNIVEQTSKVIKKKTRRAKRSIEDAKESGLLHSLSSGLGQFALIGLACLGTACILPTLDNPNAKDALINRAGEFIGKRFQRLGLQKSEEGGIEEEDTILSRFKEARNDYKERRSESKQESHLEENSASSSLPATSVTTPNASSIAPIPTPLTQASSFSPTTPPPPPPVITSPIQTPPPPAPLSHQPSTTNLGDEENVKSYHNIFETWNRVHSNLNISEHNQMFEKYGIDEGLLKKTFEGGDLSEKQNARNELENKLIELISNNNSSDDAVNMSKTMLGEIARNSFSSFEPYIQTALGRYGVTTELIERSSLTKPENEREQAKNELKNKLEDALAEFIQYPALTEYSNSTMKMLKLLSHTSLVGSNQEVLENKYNNATSFINYDFGKLPDTIKDNLAQFGISDKLFMNNNPKDIAEINIYKNILQRKLNSAKNALLNNSPLTLEGSQAFIFLEDSLKKLNFEVAPTTHSLPLQQPKPKPLRQNPIESMEARAADLSHDPFEQSRTPSPTSIPLPQTPDTRASSPSPAIHRPISGRPQPAQYDPSSDRTQRWLEEQMRLNPSPALSQSPFDSPQSSRASSQASTRERSPFTDTSDSSDTTSSSIGTSTASTLPPQEINQPKKS